MNQQEFTNLVMPFKDKVFRLAKRFLVSKDAAEDATQDVYLKLWKNKEKLLSYNNVEAFTMTMIKNHCLDVLKLKSSSNLKIIHSNYKDNSQNLDKQTDNKDSVNIIHQLIDKLPPKQKLIIQLRDVEQYSFEEIGKILEIQPTAIRVALSRARKTIREQLLKKHKYGIS